MQDNIHIIPLDHIDNVYVEELLDAAFGTDRHSRPAYALRQNTEQLDNLCFAAVHTDGLLMGTIQCWPVKITAKNDEAFADGVSLPIIMVGPVAVHPDWQNKGIGRALFATLFAALHPADPTPLMLIGDEEYYGKNFGFSSHDTKGWSLTVPYDQKRILFLRRKKTPSLPKSGILEPWVIAKP